VTATPATATWIYVTANGSNGCFDEDSILVQVGNLGSAVTATADPDIVLPGDPATLTASPSGFSYSWSPVTGLSNPNGQITQAVVEETTDYTVTVTDGICSQSSTVTVKVMDVACKEPFLYVPNAFSPNGDNENDVLYVRSAITTEILFRVFDRWGELIFESTSLSDGWDGTFRGKAVDPDTYDYYLEAICKGGDESIIKGNITLIR
jgi:gliding motility-associated-like protein